MALEPTTVRFVPGEATSPDELAIAALHLYAYERAAEHVRPASRVLDVGFGEGYGSRILIGAGAEYRGLVVDAGIVAHARSIYEGTFDTYDGATIPAADSAFDVVVSFQVIAYLADPTPWLEEIRRVLAPAGAALVTTPNRVYRLYEGQRPWNRYHAREYAADEFRDLLDETFSDVTVYGILAREPIDTIVRARADRARKLARLDPLGLRYRLPESLNTPLRRAIRRAAPPAVGEDEFSLDRVWHDEAAAADGLDLLGVVRP
jgi:SAM-dependent methyltransferase